MNIKLTLSYVGANYHGWQMQPETATVQGVLTEAVRAVMPDVAGVHGVSRTDAGVHAIEYTANFHTNSAIPLERVAAAINSHLPPDIRVYRAEPAYDTFDARFCCCSKTYLYTIDTSEIVSPFEFGRSWHIHRQLDIKKMRKAARSLVGTHDFTSFTSAKEVRENKIRTVNYIKIIRRAEKVHVYINADGFLFNMVRIIVGTLVAIGQSSGDNLREILAARDRTAAGQTAPPQGLYLLRAYYD